MKKTRFLSLKTLACVTITVTPIIPLFATSCSQQVGLFLESSDIQQINFSSDKPTKNQDFVAKISAKDNKKYVWINQIKVSNNTLSQENYTYWAHEGTLTIPAKYVTGDLQIQMSLYEPRTTFETDSWEDIIYACNRGLNGLLDLYKPANGTFIGLTRKVKVKKYSPEKMPNYDVFSGEYVVRVIGQEEDEIASTHKKAALTFEFAELLTIENTVAPKHEAFQVSYNTNPDFLNTWASPTGLSCLVRAILADADPYSLINNLEDTNLASGIKRVLKTTSIGKGSTQTDVWPETIFCLSATEIGLDSSAYCTEGKVYSYYKNKQTSEDRIKHILGGGWSGYWLRSTTDYKSKSSTYAAGISDHGAYKSNYEIEVTNLGISPVFCI